MNHSQTHGFPPERAEANRVGLEDNLSVRSKQNVEVPLVSQNVSRGTVVVNVGQVVRAALLEGLTPAEYHTNSEGVRARFRERRRTL